MRIIILSFFLVVLSFSCKTKQATSKENSITEVVALTLSNLYYQEIVPGQKNAKAQYNLHFTVLDSLIVIDSLVHNGKLGLVQNKNKKYTCRLQDQLTQKDYKVNIHYHKNKQTGHKELTHIKVKETIYMP